MFNLMRNRSRRIRRHVRPLRLELLERRETPATLASTMAFPALNDMSRQFVGLTPAIVRNAYGFDNIHFDGITGDGAGQTIAIVTAYDSPTIASDLAYFSRSFGLPDVPSFTKVSQSGTRYDSTWAMEAALDLE